MHDVDRELGIRDPSAFRDRIRAYKGEPENCVAIVQLGYSNRDIFPTDATGQRFINVLTFLRGCGGDQWQNNAVSFMKGHFRTLPKSAQEHAQPLVDEIFKAYWEWFDKLE